MDFLSLYNFSIFILVLPLAGLGFIAIKYSKNSIARLLACVLFVLSAAYTFIVPLEFTSYSKPATMEWYSRQIEEAQVLWGIIDQDTMDVTLLLQWEGSAPRLYKIENFETEQEKMEFAQDLQNAMQESQDSQEKGGTGEITLNYPFMDVEERKAQARGGNEEGSEDGTEGLQDIPGFGIEQEDDTPFSVEPPPPPNPEKTVIPWDSSTAEWDGF